MNVPFLDLKRQYSSIAAEIDAVHKRVLENGWFILGSEVEAFEREFAEYCGSTHCVTVGSGTDALHLALLAAGVGPGDEVITVSHSFIATALAVAYTGARPVFAEVDQATMNMDPGDVENKITPRTRAILPVHLYGRAADMERVMEIAAKYRLLVIEDACQAHGAFYKGRKAGTFGLAGCFSFYPGKNLGAYGDGGALVTDDLGFAENLRLLRNYGQVKKYLHRVKGYNSRLDELQAAFLRVKLRHLECWNRRRRDIARMYHLLLKDTSLVLQPADEGSSWHLYPVRTSMRDKLQNYLSGRGVSTLIHYPVPIHLQEAFKGNEAPGGRLPVTEACAREVFSLPIFPELKDDEVKYVAGVVQEFFAGL